MVFTVLYVGIVYPFLGSWKWGAGWLDAMNFYDFAGSTLVHSVGGWAAIVAVWLLGSRIGKFKDGKIEIDEDNIFAVFANYKTKSQEESFIELFRTSTASDWFTTFFPCHF